MAQGIYVIKNLKMEQEMIVANREELQLNLGPLLLRNNYNSPQTEGNSPLKMLLKHVVIFCYREEVVKITGSRKT